MTLQQHLPSIQSDTVDALMTGRVAIPLDAPENALPTVLHILNLWLEQASSPSDIALICPDKEQQTVWRQRLELHHLPVWGRLPENVYHAWETVRTTLLFCRHARAIAAGTLMEALHHPSCVQAVQTLASLKGLPPLRQPIDPVLLPESFCQHLAFWWQIVVSNSQPCASLEQALAMGLLADTPVEVRKMLTAFLQQSGNPDWTWPDMMEALGPFSEQHLVDPSRPGIRVVPLQNSIETPARWAVFPAFHSYFAGSDDIVTPTQLPIECHRDALERMVAIYDESATEAAILDRLEAWTTDWTRLDPTSGTAIHSTGVSTHHHTPGSPWLACPAQPSADSVLAGSASLTISPSEVEQLLACPRQYFYRSVLQLSEPSESPQAVFGILVHRLLEILNRHFADDYTLARLETLTHQVFAWDDHERELAELGVHATDIERLRKLPASGLQQLRQQVLAAFRQLADQGYFELPFTELVVEADLSIPNLGDLDGMTLRGRLDLLRRRPDGSYEIIDYKTSRQKYTSPRYETNLKPLMDALAAPDWGNPDFSGREYQLPLYWLMLKSLPQYQDKRVDASIQVVRPPLAGSGSKNRHSVLTLTHDMLADGAQHVMEMLRQAIYEPLETATHFTPEGDTRKQCPGCAYFHLCEGPYAQPDPGADEEAWDD